jgi:hypothetical protein
LRLPEKTPVLIAGRLRYLGFVALTLLLVIATSVSAEGLADPLLRLVPADAGATLVVEDLRGHAREILASPLAEAFRQLPAVKAWFDSDQFRKFTTARSDIEKVLGVNLTTLRDDLLGDAVVLALRARPEDGPDGARGLLLVRVRDRALLERLIATINSAEKRDGPLVEVVEKTHKAARYSIRNFRPGTKPTEFYAILDGSTLAWSNAEDLITGAIDRLDGRGGLGNDARFRPVRDGLPAHPAASLFVDPRFVERMHAADPASHKKSDDAIGPILARYFAAIQYAGAAVEWRDGLVLHTHELIDPAKLDEPIRRWTDRPSATESLLRRLPPSVFALAAGHLDFLALYDEVWNAVPEADRIKAENFVTAVRGVLFGMDPRAEVLPQVGPGLMLFLDTPASPTARVPVVLAVAVAGSPTDASSVSAALQNGLRTLLALSALDPKKNTGVPLRVETVEIDRVRVTRLTGGPTTLAFAAGEGFIVLGSTPEAVARFAAEPGGNIDARFNRVRAEFFPGVDTYAYVDLDRFRTAAEPRRAELAARIAKRRRAPEAEARRDLDKALALLSLFRTGFATSTLAPDFTWAHRTFGLLATQRL